jgi:hypothetical protein
LRWRAHAVSSPKAFPDRSATLDGPAQGGGEQIQPLTTDRRRPGLRLGNVALRDLRAVSRVCSPLRRCPAESVRVSVSITGSRWFQQRDTSSPHEKTAPHTLMNLPGGIPPATERSRAADHIDQQRLRSVSVTAPVLFRITARAAYDSAALIRSARAQSSSGLPLIGLISGRLAGCGRGTNAPPGARPH